MDDRDLHAQSAMAALLLLRVRDCLTPQIAKEIAEEAYIMAEAMLAARGPVRPIRPPPTPMPSGGRL